MTDKPTDVNWKNFHEAVAEVKSQFAAGKLTLEADPDDSTKRYELVDGHPVELACFLNFLAKLAPGTTMEQKAKVMLISNRAMGLALAVDNAELAKEMKILLDQVGAPEAPESMRGR